MKGHAKTMPRIAIFTAGFAGAAVAALVAPAAASAHVTISAPSATQGGDSILTVTVPTESDTLSTTGIKLALPTHHPFASVAVQPKAGWTYTVKKTTLSTPVQSDDGPVTDVISEVDWTATGPNTGIKPGQFDTFALSVGPLPEVDTLTFKALQTYSDGSVVSWIDVPAPGSTAQVEHAAPTLSLAPAAAAAAAKPTAAAAPSKTSDGFGIAALAIAVVALITAGGGVLRSRAPKG